MLMCALCRLQNAAQVITVFGPPYHIGRAYLVVLVGLQGCVCRLYSLGAMPPLARP